MAAHSALTAACDTRIRMRQLQAAKKEMRENALRAIMKRAECGEVIIKEWSSQGAVQDDEEKEVVTKQKTLGTDHAIKT
jgi:hypothetical protein